MALNPIRLRRSIINIGATDTQADEFVEAIDEGFDEVATKGDVAQAKNELQATMEAMEQRIVNRIMLGVIAIAGIIIGAVALLA